MSPPSGLLNLRATSTRNMAMGLLCELVLGRLPVVPGVRLAPSCSRAASTLAGASACLGDRSAAQVPALTSGSSCGSRVTSSANGKGTPERQRKPFWGTTASHHLNPSSQAFVAQHQLSARHHTTASAADAGPSTPSTSSTTPHPNTPSTARGASVDPREAAKFAALAASWWHTSEGPFAPLHALNPARVRFIRHSLAAALGLDGTAPEPLAGLRVLDVGCGGGILSESLARLGACVHGIDVTRENVEAARLHAAQDPLVAARVRYDVISAEDLASSGTAKYDVVVASEILEHVSKPHQLLPVLEALMAGGEGQGPEVDSEMKAEKEPSGAQAGEQGSVGETAGTQASGPEADGTTRPASRSALVVSTLNRTPASWALAIGAAEYVLRAVPPGTHKWKKFITPEEMAVMADACGLRVWHAAGMAPTGPRMAWQLTGDLSVNYIATLLRGDRGEELMSPQP